MLSFFPVFKSQRNCTFRVFHSWDCRSCFGDYIYNFFWGGRVFLSHKLKWFIVMVEFPKFLVQVTHKTISRFNFRIVVDQWGLDWSWNELFLEHFNASPPSHLFTLMSISLLLTPFWIHICWINIGGFQPCKHPIFYLFPDSLCSGGSILPISHTLVQSWSSNPTTWCQIVAYADVVRLILASGNLPERIVQSCWCVLFSYCLKLSRGQ